MHSRERQETSRPLVQFFVHFFVIALLAGNGVPDVNESHYIPKAKHAWDPTFAPGDLFYESSDTHMLATALAGSLSTVLPLTAVAWIGRLISWLLFSWAWTRFARALQISSAHSALALASWILAIAYGHWAGEWAIGGFEAKSIAYPLGIVGVARACEGRWKFAWLWIGGAMAWHPVVGGWIGLSCGLLWLWESKLRSSVVLPQIPWIAGGLAIGALGALPALGGIGGSGREGPIVATQVQVFFASPITCVLALLRWRGTMQSPLRCLRLFSQPCFGDRETGRPKQKSEIKASVACCVSRALQSSLR